MKYYIWALGCAMNLSDAERIASVFEDAGHTQMKSESEADIIIVVACSVRQHAIDRIYGKARAWQKRKQNGNLVTILSGCVLDKDKATMNKFFDLIFDINNVSKLAEFLNSSPLIYHSELDSESIQKKLDSGSRPGMTIKEDFFNIHPKRKSSFSAYIPISTGCNNFCTYCAVPYTRGREVSRPMKEIVSEVRSLVSAGYKEITLLGQNVNSYDSDNSEQITNNKLANGSSSVIPAQAGIQSDKKDSGQARMTNAFVELIKRIDKIPGIYRVYFYSNHPKDFSDKLIETIPKTEHFPHYIHIPLQSGSDKILKAMNRHYTQKNYFSLVNKIKKTISEVAITTDIIVGFPGETDEDFAQTKRVVREVGFDMIYIGKFSPRSGTRAVKMEDDVPQKVKEKRWQEITDLLKKHLEKENKKYVGMVLKVLIDAEKKGKYYGRTDNYKVVEIDKKSISTILSRAEGSHHSNKKQTSLLGQFADVEITDSTAWMLKGRII